MGRTQHSTSKAERTERYMQLLATKRQFSEMCWALNEKSVCGKADKEGERHLNSSIHSEHWEFPFMENLTTVSSVTFNAFRFNVTVVSIFRATQSQTEQRLRCSWHDTFNDL